MRVATIALVASVVAAGVGVVSTADATPVSRPPLSSSDSLRGGCGQRETERGIPGEKTPDEYITGFWQAKPVGPLTLVVVNREVRGSYPGGTLVGEYPNTEVNSVHGSYRSDRPWRAGTRKTGTFGFSPSMIGTSRADRDYDLLEGGWRSLDKDGDEDYGPFRLRYLGGFFDGVWKTNLGSVSLVHDGGIDKRQVKGTYPWNGGGKIQACLERQGNTLRKLEGIWEDSTGHGTFSIVISKNFDRFSGTWRPDKGKVQRWSGTLAKGPKRLEPFRPKTTPAPKPTPPPSPGQGAALGCKVTLSTVSGKPGVDGSLAISEGKDSLGRAVLVANGSITGADGGGKRGRAVKYRWTAAGKDPDSGNPADHFVGKSILSTQKGRPEYSGSPTTLKNEIGTFTTIAQKAPRPWTITVEVAAYDEMGNLILGTVIRGTCK